MGKDKLEKICRLIRFDILTSTTQAGSGHPTSSLSAVELMANLFFGIGSNGNYFHFDFYNPKKPENDRLIFSKGHAAPLLYSLYHVAGVITGEDLMSLRQFGSKFEGHPVPRLKYVDVATGSLGQGLSIGVGMAMALKLKIKKSKTVRRDPKVWVLLGDSEMAEGQVWEAMETASHYALNNLIAIVDVNRLGQSTETMGKWDLDYYLEKAKAFGWGTYTLADGHNFDNIDDVYRKIYQGNHVSRKKPVMIVAKTVKGKGVGFLENKEGWHGKPVPKDMLESAIKGLGKIDFEVRGKVVKPEIKFLENITSDGKNKSIDNTTYQLNSSVATREAYGDALVSLGQQDENLVVLDAEVSNSTFSEKFRKIFPNRYFEMFLTEQNMIDVGLGMSKIGFNVYLSTFAGFLSRAFDQIRIAQYSQADLKITQSHAGVSIGYDGPSQMALEDLAMMRGILESTVLYPSDAVSSYKLSQMVKDLRGIVYLRMTREKTPVIYAKDEIFKIGGSKVHTSTTENKKSRALIIAAGITLREALKAQKRLKEQNIDTTVIDLYSIKPLDGDTVIKFAKEIKNVIVVEDHYPAGGIGEAVSLLIIKSGLAHSIKMNHLCVRKIPMSGTPDELIKYMELDSDSIIKVVKI